MNMLSRKISVALCLAASGACASAQDSPVGLWRSLDDKTGEAKAEIRVQAAADGTLSGRIERSLKKDGQPNAVCERCTDERKGQPIAGLQIIRGGSKTEGQQLWEQSKILDPENGKEYRASLKPIDGGSKLEVRGYLGPFWRTQTWTRVQ